MRRSPLCVIGLHRWRNFTVASGAHWRRCTRDNCHTARFVIESWEKK